MRALSIVRIRRMDKAPIYATHKRRVGRCSSHRSFTSFFQVVRVNAQERPPCGAAITGLYSARLFVPVSRDASCAERAATATLC